MANHTSTKKAVRKTKRVSEVNRNRKSRIKTYVKKFLTSVGNSTAEEVSVNLVKAQSEIMKGVSKGIIKKNTASRKISRLAKLSKNTA